LLALVEATVRTTWPGAATVAFKLDSAQVPFLPAPRPYAEVYVWSPWFEGLHLRFGPVARGGIRWSDRAADLRGEVLALARAQVKKNSLIVPTGAKGAFTLRPASGPGFGVAAPVPAPAPAEGRRAYRAFITALLELTDNIVDGKVVHPPIVCRDGDDPYLVVAADKGTATFSDLANEVSAERGFWLGDAFASGGSHGYDHKALGITARGVWLAVRRHFRALGMDADEDEIRVAGVGDMSGDVFGNGMLQSRHLSLVAAFDHRQVFIDPSPVPATAFEERLRLSRLPASSWGNYDLAVASPGAAVYPRQAKEVEVPPQAATALAMERRRLSPPQLVQAVLRAPVDLLFFGGIGTFVRGPGDDEAAIEDHANDEVRLNASELRARVVAEGANLAMTPAARAAYSRRGGRVNADFVDNAAGVALSDREVNLKVLLALAISSGALEAGARLGLLAEGEAEAAASVLRQADEGIIALDRAAASSAGDFPAYVGLLNDLEGDGLFERDVEALPSEDELVRRAEAGAGFSRPELAVLVAYARSELARSIEPSPLTSGDELGRLVLGYFPAPFQGRLGHLVGQHPLYRQLGASTLANELLASMGPVWAHESALETGRPLYEGAAAYWAAREVLGAGPVIALLAQEADRWPMEAETLARDALARAIGRLARWCLLRPGPVRAADVAAAQGPLVGDVLRLVPGDDDLERALAAAGTPPAVARQLGQLVAASSVGPVAAVCDASGRPASEAMAALEAVGDAFPVRAIGRFLSGPAPIDRWERRQMHLLADDLSRCLVSTAAAALGSSDGPDARAAVAGYLARRSRPVSSLSALAGALAAPGPVNLSLVALVVRAMGRVEQEPADEPGGRPHPAPTD
jgi:glutamate dehydrogenase